MLLFMMHSPDPPDLGMCKRVRDIEHPGQGQDQLTLNPVQQVAHGVHGPLVEALGLIQGHEQDAAAAMLVRVRAFVEKQAQADGQVDAQALAAGKTAAALAAGVVLNGPAQPDIGAVVRDLVVFELRTLGMAGDDLPDLIQEFTQAHCRSGRKQGQLAGAPQMFEALVGGLMHFLQIHLAGPYPAWPRSRFLRIAAGCSDE